MMAMKKGDEAFFYHSNIGKECVGIMEITEERFPDPTADKGSPWVVVRVAPMRALAHPVTLAAIKADPKLAAMDLIRQPRLSVGRDRKRVVWGKGGRVRGNSGGRRILKKKKIKASDMKIRK